eukprot:12038715-Prorocentrum_lima.AAC.1
MFVGPVSGSSRDQPPAASQPQAAQVSQPQAAHATQAPKRLRGAGSQVPPAAEGNSKIDPTEHHR